MPLVYKADNNSKPVHLLSTKWNPKNINLLGTKILKILFTEQELAASRIEQPQLLDRPQLDPIKLNVLKGKLTLNYF